MDGIEILTQEPLCVKDLPHSVQITFEIICNLSTKRDYCFAFNKTLAEMRKVSLATIKRHIAILIEAGLITCRHVGHDRRLYPNEPPLRHLCATNEPLHNTKETLRETKGKDSFVCKENKHEDTPTPSAHSEDMPISEENIGTTHAYAIPIPDTTFAAQPPNPLTASVDAQEGIITERGERENGRSAIGSSMAERPYPTRHRLHGNRVPSPHDTERTPLDVSVERDGYLQAEDFANAERLAACWNEFADANIPTEAIPGSVARLVEIARELLDESNMPFSERHKIRAALAAFEKKTP